MPLYAGPIVDAHHHFWEPSLGRQPWLRPDVLIPFRYGDYTSIKRDYLPPDLLADAQGFDVVGTVTMETEWEDDDPIGEMDYTAGIAEKYSLPTASVAHALLDAADVGDTLEQLAARPLVRAVRHKPGQAADRSAAPSHRTLMVDPDWRRGFALLEPNGLDFELQVAWWHFDQAAALADDFPGTRITINHAGLPSDRSAEGLAGWAAAIRSMAERDNVAIKISGIGLRGVPWTADNNRPIVEAIAEAFGSDRIMFASNFPVDRLTATYAEIFGGFAEITADWSSSEQQAAFAGNAVRLYRLPADLLDRS